MTNNSPNNHKIPLFILLFMAIGVPTAAAVAFAEKITQNPWKTFAIALIYEILVFVSGFIGKVWKKLEDPWIERTANNVDKYILGRLSGYKKRYFQNLVYQHNDFDVKGLTNQGKHTLSLNKVFVDLTIAPETLSNISSHLTNYSKENNKYSRTIWEYVDSKYLENNNLVIVGPPGSGKTTLLKHVTISLALRDKKQRINKIPIILFIRDYVEYIIEKADIPLWEITQISINRFGWQSPPNDWFRDNLNNGRCLVMLDGLDEVADERSRKKVVAWIQRQMIAHPSNTFIVTSRPFGYRKNPLSRVTVLEVSPFTIDQVRKFISNWYIANEIMDRQKDNEGVRLIAFHGAEDLIRRLRNTPALLELAVNPLLLTMIATVHKYKNSLPGRRIDLYAEICDVFLGKIQLARGLTLDLTPTQKQIVLQTLAYEMMKLKTRMIEAPQASKIIKESLRRVGPQYTEIEFLKMIEDSSGILLEREVGVYSFAHLTFQEYLAAAYIKGQPTNKILIDNIDNSWWHETIRLYAAQGDATSIIDACLVNEDLSSAMLTLAIQCIDEAGQVSQEARIRLENVLSVGLDDSNTQLMIAETLLSIRVSSMHRISESKYIDRLPITNAEYQLFINEQGFYYVPDTWKGENYKKGSGRNVVTGIRPNDAESFCRWLSAKFAGEWYFRLPTLDELHNEFNEVNYRHPDLLRGYWCKEVDNNYTFFSIDSPVDINIENIYQLIQKDTNVFKLHGINLINYVNKMQTSLDIKNLRQIQGLTNLVNLFNRIDELKKIDINIKLIDKILTHIGDKKDAFDIEIIYFDVEDLDRKMPLNSMEKKDYIRILLVTLEKIIKYTYNRDFWNSCHNHLYDTKNVYIDRIITLDKILLDIDKKKIFIKKSGLETHKKLEQDYNLVCQGDFNFIEKNAEIIVKQDASVSNIFYADRIKKVNSIMEDLWKGKNDWITDVEKLTIWYQENIYNNKDLDNYRDILDKMINTIRTVILEKGIIERDNEILISYQKQLYLTIINKSKEFNYKITSDEIKSLEEPKFNAENEIEQIENLIKYVDKVLYHKYKEITQIKSYTNWYARFLSLCIINELYNNKNKNDEIDSSLDLTIDIYANLCIFQQRILGTIVPFEGFLLIKEISLPTVEGNFSTDSRS